MTSTNVDVKVDRLFAEFGQSAGGELHRIDYPVLPVNGDGRELPANSVPTAYHRATSGVTGGEDGGQPRTREVVTSCLRGLGGTGLGREYWSGSPERNLTGRLGANREDCRDWASARPG